MNYFSKMDCYKILHSLGFQTNDLSISCSIQWKLLKIVDAVNAVKNILLPLYVKENYRRKYNVAYCPWLQKVATTLFITRYLPKVKNYQIVWSEALYFLLTL